MHKYKNLQPHVLNWILAHTSAQDLFWYMFRGNLSKVRYISAEEVSK